MLHMTAHTRTHTHTDRAIEGQGEREGRGGAVTIEDGDTAESNTETGGQSVRRLLLLLLLLN